MDSDKTLRQYADIEADEEYNLDEIKGSIKRQNCVLYHAKWLGFRKKTDWTSKRYENFSMGVWMKLLQIHINYLNAPPHHRVILEP